MNIPAIVWLAGNNAGVFVVWGIFLPFWALWLQHQGLSEASIGSLMGAGMLARALGSMTLMPLAKTEHQLFTLLRWIALAALFCFCALLWFEQHYSLWLFTLLISAFVATQIPINDAILTQYVKQYDYDYGRIRVFGSLGFVAASIVMGQITREYGNDWILYGALITAILAWLFTLYRPKPMIQSRPITGRKTVFSSLSILALPQVRRFILITACIQGSHAAYYAYGSIYFDSLGFDKGFIGMLWSVGVLCEIIIFIFAKRWFAGWSSEKMLFLAASGGFIRWIVTALSANGVVLALAQTLHAFTFSITQIAAIKHIADDKQAEHAISLQALYATFALNFGTSLLIFVCSIIFPMFNGYTFFLMAAFNIFAMLLILKPHLIRKAA